MSRVYITGNLENIKRYSGGRWNKLARNVRSNQSLDDNVVTHRVMDVADYPSAIKCGISFVVMEKSVYRIMHLKRLRISNYSVYELGTDEIGLIILIQ